MWNLEAINRMNRTEVYPGVRYVVYFESKKGVEQFSAENQQKAWQWALANSAGETFRVEEVQS